MGHLSGIHSEGDEEKQDVHVRAFVYVCVWKERGRLIRQMLQNINNWGIWVEDTL